MNRFLAVGLLAMTMRSALVIAQGVQTGTITGVVQSGDHVPVAGVSVAATSPALLGRHTATTDVNGVYVIKGLPPGTYRVAFEHPNLEPVSREDLELSVGATADASGTIRLAGRTETVTVTAPVSSTLGTVAVSQAYTKRDVDLMPVGRRPQDIAELAPGLTNVTPNVSQVTISGATAFDNVFMVNGVDINDNLFGSPNGLYIEDAIVGTTILTGGVSAEYGRFTGGVINVITKSGGNIFSGSVRENFSNPTWIRQTPREQASNITHADVLSKTSEGTFGGPLVKDRLWFFAAGRYVAADTPQTFILSDASTTRHDINKRGELKFTGSVANGHIVSADYTNNSLVQTNVFSLNSNALDPSALVNPTTPNALFVSNYNGVIAGRYFAMVRYSQKENAFENAGGTNTALSASPFRTRGVTPGIAANLLYAAPFFSALDPEQRNNRQFTGSVSRTLSSKKRGTHDIKAGGEYYRSQRTGGNSQSATGYVFQADYLQSGGKPVYDAVGVPIPNFVPGQSRLQNWMATAGAVIDINTTSLFVQDHWRLTPRLSVDLGTRFEAVRSHATGDIVTADTSSLVPRFGVSYDLQGNGKTVVQATYGHYAGKYTERQFGVNTDIGTPSLVTYAYTGPAGQGRDFAPGFALSNYTSIVAAAFPTANIVVAPGLSSPIVREFTLGVGRELNERGYAKVTYQFRRWYGFVDDFIQLSNGLVNVNRSGVNIGNLTKVLFDNASNDPNNGVFREYQALVLQSSYRYGGHLSVGGHYTLQIENNGNNNGEAPNQTGNPSVFGDFPEILGPALDRYLPSGRLADFQRHKLRLYGTYSQGMGRFGTVDISPIWRVDSGQVFSYTAASVPLTPIELARNPGYPINDINPSTALPLFFGDRGAGDFRGSGLLDLAATYTVPVWRSAKPWIKVELYNVLDNDKLVRWDTTVTADPNSPKDGNGLPTGYIPGPNFGKAVQDNQFPQPVPGTNGGRLFRMAFGFRF
ncbi:MAG: TonB-dependent receptor [Acidobacteriota bacterium]